MRHGWIDGRFVCIASAGIMAGAALSPARALEPVAVSQEVQSADACIKTIKTMGSNMGYQAAAGPNGKAVYKFVLRAAGVDYDAVCDAQSGMVTDVTRRPVN